MEGWFDIAEFKKTELENPREFPNSSVYEGKTRVPLEIRAVHMKAKLYQKEANKFEFVDIGEARVYFDKGSESGTLTSSK